EFDGEGSAFCQSLAEKHVVQVSLFVIEPWGELVDHEPELPGPLQGQQGVHEALRDIQKDFRFPNVDGASRSRRRGYDSLEVPGEGPGVDGVTGEGAIGFDMKGEAL